MTRAEATARSCAAALAALPQRVLIGIVRFYRLFLSAWLGSQCRFEPTCSRYALEALERHGAAGGSYLAARRILRCSPWCAGGCDPVPEPRPGRTPAQPAVAASAAGPVAPTALPSDGSSRPS